MLHDFVSRQEGSHAARHLARRNPRRTGVAFDISKKHECFCHSFHGWLQAVCGTFVFMLGKLPHDKITLFRVENAPQATPLLPGFPLLRVLHLNCCFSQHARYLGDGGEHIGEPLLTRLWMVHTYRSSVEPPLVCPWCETSCWEAHWRRWGLENPG